MQQVKDGWYEMKWRGEGKDMVQVYSRHDGQFAQVGRSAPLKIPDALKFGYTFVPLVAFPPERVAALETILAASRHYAPAPVVEAQKIVRAMLDEIGGEA